MRSWFKKKKEIWAFSQGVDGKILSASYQEVEASITLSRRQSGYLIHNANTNDFSSLRPGFGIEVNCGDAISLYSDVNLPDGAMAKIIIINYDINRRKINHCRYPIAQNIHHEITEGVHYITICLRIEGQGKYKINKYIFKYIKASLRKETKNTLKKVSSSDEKYDHINAKCKSTGKPLQDRMENLLASNKESLSSLNDKYLVLSLRNTRLFLESASSFIAVSNGSEYYSPLPLTVAIITDIFMYNFYEGAFDRLLYLSPDNYQEVLENNHIDFFIYVSNWEGLNNHEWKGIKFREKPKNALEKILQHCRDNDIPTVFQTIEDPSNYDYFLPIASGFDNIFTSDVDKIEDYERDCSAKYVGYAEYGANPMLNNPIGSASFQFEGAFYAGSYPARYKDRCDDMNVIFSSILKSGGSLIVANRNSHLEDKNLKFPKQFTGIVIDRLEHKLLQRVHKLFRYNINFNSIKYSPSMCAMRVYELQAQGTILLSNYAKSVNYKFPNIQLMNDALDFSFFIDSAYVDEMKIRQYDGVRNIMSNKTSFDCAANIASKIGVYDIEDRHKSVLVLLKGDEEVLGLSFERQTYSNKHLHSFDQIDNLDLTFYDYITVFVSGRDYEPNYLTDMVNAFKYTDSKYVTKNVFYTDDGVVNLGQEHQYTNVMSGADLTLFSTKKHSVKALLKLLNTLTPCFLEGGYSIDALNMNHNSYMRSKYLASGFFEGERLLSVIVPVYNNGKFLTHKCFSSLMRNKLFPQMEILLVDDGSTDCDTIKTIERLDFIYPNVKLYIFPIGGSGSASRARNKGLELATCDLITYLDPDNEISPGGYDILYNHYVDSTNRGRNVDFVSGYNFKVAEEGGSVCRHTKGKPLYIDNLRDDFLLKKNFPVISTQAAVIRRRLLLDNAIDFVEGAIGQDTLFGHEVLFHASAGLFCDDAQLIYYAERPGSVTNQIDVAFFEKSLILERVQKHRLEKVGMLQKYKENKLNAFVEGWYKKKLELVKAADYQKAEGIVQEIINVYM